MSDCATDAKASKGKAYWSLAIFTGTSYMVLAAALIWAYIEQLGLS